MRQLLGPVLVPIVGGLVFLVALLGLIGTAIRDPHPHDLAVGLVGPAPAVQQISSAFAGNAPGAFRFTTADDVGFSTRLLVVLGYAVLTGPIAMGAAEWIAGDYGSGIWAAIGLLMLGAAAVGAVVAGLVRLLGRAGLALAALIVVLLDLVSSGGPVGSQLLPDFYRWLAPWMAAGPLYSGLRGALYFDGAGTGQPILILAEWFVAGIALMAVGELVFYLMHRGSLPPETVP